MYTAFKFFFCFWNLPNLLKMLKLSKLERYLLPPTTHTSDDDSGKYCVKITFEGLERWLSSGKQGTQVAADNPL